MEEANGCRETDARQRRTGRHAATNDPGTAIADNALIDKVEWA